MVQISIIIPSYNAEEYLEACLESALRQDIRDKEIICVDDGSTDGTLEILRRYQGEYANIRVLTQSNLGSGPARNAALDVANGQYVAFLDSDDYYLDPTALRKMVETCEKNKVMICGSLRRMIIGEELHVHDLWRDEVEGQTAAKKFLYEDYQVDLHYHSYVINRKLLEDNKIRFMPLRRYQDPPFFAKAMWCAKEFMVEPVELYAYRSRIVPMKYSFTQLNDALSGIYVNLKFAKEEGLWKLFQGNVEQVTKGFLPIVEDSVRNGNLIALMKLIEMDEYIHKNLPSELAYHLNFLDEISHLLWESKFCNMMYEFPYDEIAYKSSVAVYGAGVVGKEVVNKINSLGYCSLSAWVDQRYDKIREEGIIVYAPDELLRREFDCLIIAVESKELFQEIKEVVIKNNWNNGKPIVGPIKKKAM